jgi:hypothetical protein
MRIKVLPTDFIPGPYMASKYIDGGSESAALGHKVESRLHGATMTMGKHREVEHSASTYDSIGN